MFAFCANVGREEHPQLKLSLAFWMPHSLQRCKFRCSDGRPRPSRHAFCPEIKTRRDSPTVRTIPKSEKFLSSPLTIPNFFNLLILLEI